jgi:hypothetical protein
VFILQVVWIPSGLTFDRIEQDNPSSPKIYVATTGNRHVMANRRSVAAILLFAGSLLCFFLPFATVSCGGAKVATFSGGQLAMGTTVTQPALFGPAQSQRIPASPSAAVAFLCSLAGLILSAVGRKLAAGAAMSGSVGAVSLMVLDNSLKVQSQQAMGMMQVNMEAGYTLALLLMASGAGWNVYLILKDKGKLANKAEPSGQQFQEIGPAAAGADASSPSTAADPPPRRFCESCGRPILGVRFCESCGAPHPAS